MPRAYAVEESGGLMKFVVDADMDPILGTALVGVDAQQIINTVALAASRRACCATAPTPTQA